MKKTFFLWAILLSMSAVFAYTLVQAWQITDKYAISFSSNDASGIFKTFSGSILFDVQNIAASKFDVTVDARTINTGNGLMNKDAKSEEWFDVAKYPEIRFTSTKMSKTGNDYQVTGDLEMHGVSKELTIPFTFQQQAGGATFHGIFTVNRNDFHLGKPGDVAELIKIDVSVPVIKK